MKCRRSGRKGLNSRTRTDTQPLKSNLQQPNPDFPELKTTFSLGKSVHVLLSTSFGPLLIYFLPGGWLRSALISTQKGPCQSTDTAPSFVPRPGIEPGWIAPLVFETSASTDSAIWALLDLSATKIHEIHIQSNSGVGVCRIFCRGFL